jgi:hypothetical protein
MRLLIFMLLLRVLDETKVGDFAKGARSVGFLCIYLPAHEKAVY